MKTTVRLRFHRERLLSDTHRRPPPYLSAGPSVCWVGTRRWDEFERLRPLCYRDAGVFLLCYSVVLPSSFRSVTSRWAPEVHHLCPGVPIILVGTRSDLREDVQVLIRLADGQEKPVSGDDARLCARSISAVTFAECSALTQKNLKEVFDGAILAGTRHTEAAAWPRMHALREKTPDKIRQLSET